MMNDNDELKNSTKALAYIGEHAGSSRFSAVLNKMFKESSVDAMIIPMNIREDDLFFTISNMKKSKLDGAIISDEYVTQVVEILDESSSMVKKTGMCDIIYKQGEILSGDIFSLRVLTEHLKDMMVSKVAIIGTNHYAKAFTFLACGFNVSYYSDSLEELMTFTQELEIHDADLNRLSIDMQTDLSVFDVVLDFSQMGSLGMVTKLGKLNMDLKNNKQFSALKQRANELGVEYTSSDNIVDKLCKKAYIEIVK